MLSCKLYQVLTIPKPLREPITIGRPVPVWCEGSHCPDRTAPVFLSFGTAGIFRLCGHCHAGRVRLLRAMLPVVRPRMRWTPS